MKYYTFIAAISTFFSLLVAAPTSTSPNPQYNSAILPRELGINCRGSGLCPLATFEDPLNVNVAQGLRDAIWSSTLSDDTEYNSGDHVICISESLKITISAGVDQAVGDDGTSVTVGLSASGKIGTGGICVFPQGLQVPLTLGKIKPLADALLKHGCATCGSVPVHFVDEGSNDPSEGILTFNYVGSPYCIETCISASG